jgi:hypothetical protein
MRSVRAAAPWVVLVAVLVRLPGFIFEILGSDDADFTVIARAMAQGCVPFRDVVDIKPPLAFVCYLPNAWFGGALWPVQVEGALFVAGTALVLGFAATRTWKSEHAGATASFLALAAGLCEAPTVSTELLMNLPTAIAFAVFARSEHEGRQADDFYAGLFLGLAALIRQQAVFSLAALGLATVGLGLWARRPWLWRCALLAAGFALPWLTTLGVFQRLGALPDFLDWVVLRNLRYVSQSAGSSALRLLQSLAVCVLAAAPLAWWAGLAGFRGALQDARGRLTADPPRPRPYSTPSSRLRATWAVLLLVTVVPVSLGGRFYEHYFLHFVPAIALLGAGPLDALLEDARAWPRARRAAIAALALLPAIGSVAYATARGLLGQYPLQDKRVQAIGAWVRANSAPDARLFVWGHFSAIYLASARLPGTRYVTTSWQLGNFDPQHIDDSIDLRRFRSERDLQQTKDDLARRRPEWVIDTAPADIHSWHREPLSLLPDLEAAIDAGWERVDASPGGARILRRR